MVEEIADVLITLEMICRDDNIVWKDLNDTISYKLERTMNEFASKNMIDENGKIIKEKRN